LKDQSEDPLAQLTPVSQSTLRVAARGSSPARGCTSYERPEPRAKDTRADSSGNFTVSFSQQLRQPHRQGYWSKGSRAEFNLSEIACG
jgi:hypothetical protein